MADDTLSIVIKTRGGREAAAEARALAAEYRRLGTGSVNVQHGIEGSNKAISRGTGLMGASLRMVGALTAGLGAMAAAKAGINFNAEMETSRIGLEFFLKSADAADKQMRELIALGQQMPGLGQGAFVTSAKQLMAFGLTASQVTPLLTAVGAAVNASGEGPQGLLATTRSLGQILATGKVQGDELNELANHMVFARKYLYESGLAKRGTDIGLQNIQAEPAIAAIQAGLQRDYAGLTPKLNKTWANQTAAAKQYAIQASAAFMKPFQDWLSSGVLSGVGKRLQGLGQWLNAGAAEKFWKTMGLLIQAFGPALALLAAWRTAVLVVTAAQWLWNAAMTANPIGLIIVGIGLLIGIVILLVKHWDAVKAAFMATWDWITAHPWVAIFLGPIGAMVVIATQVVKHWGTIKTVISKTWDAVKPILMTMWNIIKKIIEWSPMGVVKKASDMFGGDIPGVPFLAAGGNVRVGGRAITGEAGPELIEHKGDSVKVTPLTQGGAASGSRVLQPLYLMVNGKVFADVMVDVSQTAAARR